MRKLYSCPPQKFAGCFWQCCKNLSRQYENAKMANLLHNCKEIQTTKTRNSVSLKTKQSTLMTHDRSKKIPHWNFTAKSIVASGKKQPILRTSILTPGNAELAKYAVSIKTEEPIWKDTVVWKISILRTSVKQKNISTREALWNRPIISIISVYKNVSVGKLHFSGDIPCSVMH